MNKNKKIKLVVWDLDNTIWEGTLLEDKEVKMKDNVRDIIRTLDERGILQSISSKNHYESAIEKIKNLGIDEYFIYPHINWNSKSESIVQIIKKINIGCDTVAFIDDQPYELDEVKSKLDDVLCIPANEIDKWINHERFLPDVITDETRLRRKIYQSEIQRNIDEMQFSGPKEEFLRLLNIRLTISEAKANDLDRIIELTERTNQINATGYTYSYDELSELMKDVNHCLLVISLDDKYGYNGKIGLVLIGKEKGIWEIKLFIMSCRIISRGIGTIILYYLIQKAKENQVQLYARFIQTDYNRIMLMTYTMAGFKRIKQEGELIILENTLEIPYKFPDYILINDENAFVKH